MEFKVTGVYTNKRVSTFSNSLLIYRDDKVYEVEDQSPESRHYSTSNMNIVVDDIALPVGPDCLKIRIFEQHVFFCYRRMLQIFNRQTKYFVELESNADIFIGSQGFLLFNKTYFIVNHSAEYVLVPEHRNLLNFTRYGLLYTVGCTEAISENRSWEIENSVAGCLFVESLKGRQLYDEDGECLLELDNYMVFRDNALIEEIVSCASIQVEVESNTGTESKFAETECAIILCRRFVFVIIDGLIVKKKLDSQYTRIIPEEFIIHNYFQECTVHDCLLVLNCFRTVRLYNSQGIENFLANIITQNDATTKFIDGLITNTTLFGYINYLTILCRVYRLVDEGGRKVLENYIDFTTLNLDQLYCVIIYKNELLDKFISLCKSEERLFYLIEVKDFYTKIGMDSFCRKKFLEQGLLIFEYRGLEKFNEIEKKQIESQRLMYLMKEP